MKLSIVTTLYNSAPYLNEFHRLATEEARLLTDDYEIVLVNDGSPDNSLAMALKLYENDPHVRVIDLSRNFGEHKARMTGLMQATGDIIFLIQCDLEVSPHYLQEFWKEMQEGNDIDLVYGIQKKRRGNWWERIVSISPYVLVNLFSDTKVGLKEAGCRLMTRRFADALILHQDRVVFFAGLCALTGFGQKAHIVIKNRFNKGSYSLEKRITTALDALISFSFLPLKIVFYSGCLITLLAFAVGMAVIIHGGAGYSALILTSVWLIGGMILTSIGIAGLYLSRVLLETKQRPYTIIKRIYGSIAP